MIPVDLWTAFGRFGMLVVHRRHTIQSHLLATYEERYFKHMDIGIIPCTQRWDGMDSKKRDASFHLLTKSASTYVKCLA